MKKISLYIQDELDAALDAESKRTGIPRSEIIRRALAERLGVEVETPQRGGNQRDTPK